MLIAYVRVDLGRSEGGQSRSFVVSPVPFLYREGEYAMPPGTQVCKAGSFSALRVLLTGGYHIPASALPPPRYFSPTKEEKDQGWDRIYRTVPRGAGEPEWRTRARQALLDAVDEASWSFMERATLTVNGKDCFSIEELKQELASVAESAGGRRKVRGEAYQPDYDVLVKEALGRDGFLLQLELPKFRKRKDRTDGKA